MGKLIKIYFLIIALVIISSVAIITRTVFAIGGYGQYGISTIITTDERYDLLLNFASAHNLPSKSVDNYYKDDITYEKKYKENVDIGGYKAKLEHTERISIGINTKYIEGSVNDIYQESIKEAEEYKAWLSDPSHHGDDILAAKVINISGYNAYLKRTGRPGNEDSEKTAYRCWPGSPGKKYNKDTVYITAYIPQGDDRVPTASPVGGRLNQLLIASVSVDEYGDRIQNNNLNLGKRAFWRYCVEDQEQKAISLMSDLLADLKPYIDRFKNGGCLEDEFCDWEFGENCQTCESDCSCEEFEDTKCDPEFGRQYFKTDPYIKSSYESGSMIGGPISRMCMHSSLYDKQPQPPPEEKITLELAYDKKEVLANGKDIINFVAKVSDKDEPLDNQELVVNIDLMDKQYESITGQYQPIKGYTDGNGIFKFEYQPPVILPEDKLDYTTVEGSGIMMKAEVEHTKSSTKTGRKIIVLPYRPKLTVDKIEAIQALRKMPLVAGKKMVLIIGINSKEDDLFEENDKLKFLMDFKIEFDQFKPKNNFEKIDISQPPADDFMVRIDQNDDGYAEHLDFMQISEDSQTKEWLFYDFYIDPQDTHKQGTYLFKTKLFGQYKDPVAGKDKLVPFDYSFSIDDVYPSGFISIKVLPLAVGMWHEDFCQFCTTPSSFSQRNENSNKRLFGGPVERGSDWEFTCKQNIFSYTWDGFYTSDQLYNVLYKNTKLRSFFGMDVPERRASCQEGFTDLFLKQRIIDREVKSLLDELEDRGTFSLRGEIKTQKEKYLELARKSAAYLKAVVPLAEENVIIHIQQDPYYLPGLNPHAKYPSLILYRLGEIKAGRVYSNSTLTKLSEAISIPDMVERLEYESAGKPEFQGYTRIAAFVPTAGGQASNIKLEEEGYENTIFNPWAVIINNDIAEEDVLVHEISHTYCAVDEAEQVRQTLVLTGICGEGAKTINFNWNLDDLGDRVDGGYWVDKREIRGRPGKLEYSYMGNAGQTDSSQRRWVSKDLYYGLGVKLGVFPSDKESKYIKEGWGYPNE